jgi:superfamily I DNA/RNA helicase
VDYFVRQKRAGATPVKKLDWTHEQTQILDLSRAGDSICVLALAGCGKTTILRAIAQHTPRRVVYLAFNERIATESRESFPANAACMTTHALVHRQLPAALRAKGIALGHDLTAPMLHGFLKRRFEIAPNELWYASSVVIGMLQAFCISADTEIGPQHSPYRHFTSLHRDPYDDESTRRQIRWSQAAWQSIISADGELPLPHDAYLKFGFLNGVRFDYDVLLVDEVQDLNPVTLAIIARSGCQIVYVGDRNQQLYEWRGAIDAMDSVKVDRIARLTQSWRLGPAVAEVANRLLGRLGDEQIRPNPKVHACIATRHQRFRIVRSNTTLFVKTVECASRHQRVHIFGGTAQLHALVDAVERLQRGRRVWDGVLSGYHDWQEACGQILSRRGGSLKTFVQVANELGVDRMRRGLNKLPKKAEDADVVLSTVHAAKGCERDHVSVYHDFKGDKILPVRKIRYIPAEQWRLMYVAVTRAMKSIFVESGARKRFGI